LLEAEFFFAGGNADCASVVSQSAPSVSDLMDSIDPGRSSNPVVRECWGFAMATPWADGDNRSGYVWAPATRLISLFGVSNQQTSSTV
jgi:hypothetical protein